MAVERKLQRNGIKHAARDRDSFCSASFRPSGLSNTLNCLFIRDRFKTIRDFLKALEAIVF